MCLQVGEDIGAETHANNDHFYRFESGEGKCIIDKNEYHVAEGDASVVPASAMHKIINTGTEEFKLYTTYSPPNHGDGTLRKTKKDTDRRSEKLGGKTSE